MRKLTGAFFTSILQVFFRSIFILFIFQALVACSTFREIQPRIPVQPRTGLEVRPAVFFSLFDGRTGSAQIDILGPLQNDLSQIYGNSIEWKNYFEKPVQGRVTLRIRIIMLGATFGSRLISSSSFATALSNAKTKATVNIYNQNSPWGKIIADVEGSSTSQQLVLGGSFSGEGWWNGAAWVDVEIQDLRGAQPVIFTLPIAGEFRESNMWGYASGDRAAREAWNKVSTILMRVLDSTLSNIRNQQA